MYELGNKFLEEARNKMQKDTWKSGLRFVLKSFLISAFLACFEIFRFFFFLRFSFIIFHFYYRFYCNSDPMTWLKVQTVVNEWLNWLEKG